MNKVEGMIILFGSLLIIYTIIFGSIQTLELEISYTNGYKYEN